MKKSPELKCYSIAVALTFAVLLSGCPTDNLSNNNGLVNGPENGKEDEVSGIPEHYTLFEAFRLLSVQSPGFVMWRSVCGTFRARFRANIGLQEIEFGVTNRVTPTGDISVSGGAGNFNIAGRTRYPFNTEARLSMEKTSEGGVSWTMHDGRFWVAGEIRFDYYEGEVLRVMFYVTEFRTSFGPEIDRVKGLNGTWLYRE